MLRRSLPSLMAAVVLFVAVAFAITVAAGATPAAGKSPATGPDPAAIALETMLETERAFARLSESAGMRAAFLIYIADEGIGFRPGPVALKEAMRADPEPPPGLKLLWEPRYGDIAASGEYGYLTGPYTIESPSPDGGLARGHGCFFSVWHRPTRGEWRNVLDIGVRLPEPATFAPGFTRAPHADRWNALPDPGRTRRGLREAEEALHRAARAGSFATALGDALDPAGRVYRDGRAPCAGREAAVRALDGSGALAEAETLFARAAASGDFGYTYGRYVFAGAGAERGHYARVWVRDAAGTWRVAADLTSPDAAGSGQPADPGKPAASHTPAGP